MKHLFSIDQKQERKNEHFNPVFLVINIITLVNKTIILALFEHFIFAIVDC